MYLSDFILPKTILMGGGTSRFGYLYSHRQVGRDIFKIHLYFTYLLIILLLHKKKKYRQWTPNNYINEIIYMQQNMVSRTDKEVKLIQGTCNYMKQLYDKKTKQHAF